MLPCLLPLLLCLSQAAKVTAVHVTSCQDEFRQQQMAVLWRASGATHAQVNGTQTKLVRTVLLFDQCVCRWFLQRHLVCGPVKTPGSQLSATEYLQ